MSWVRTACTLLLLMGISIQAVHVCTTGELLGARAATGTAIGSRAAVCLLCVTAQSAAPTLSLVSIHPLGVTAASVIAPPLATYSAPIAFALHIRPPPAS